MKRIFLYIIGVALTLSACDLEHSENDDLDGMWQLRTVDSIGSGVTVDMRPSQRVWAFQGSLMEARLLNSGNRTDYIIFRFDHQGQTLRLYSPYVSNRDVGDAPVDSIALLSVFGINSTDETFRVQHLSAETMTLESTLVRLHFRKY